MKTERGSTLRLGIFVVTGLLIFIMGVFYIGQKQRLFSRTIKIKFVCANVSGLQAGNNVRFSGINVGTVANIILITDTAAQVEMVIEKRVKKFIKKDAAASVGSDGLMGDKVVNISPGSPNGQEIENNDVIGYEGGNSLDEIMRQVKIVSTNAASMTGDLADIISNIHQGKGAVGKLLSDSTFAKNLDQTMVSVKQGAKGFKEDMDAAQHSFLLKGYFKKKQKENEKKQKEQQEKENKK